jgi:outer membrane protein insertion porin family
MTRLFEDSCLMVRARHLDYRVLCAVTAILCVVLLTAVPRAPAQSFPGPGGAPDPFSQRPPGLRPPASPEIAESCEYKGPIADVRIEGNQGISTAKIRSYLKTRPGRPFDPETVQADVRHLLSRGSFRDVRTFTQNTPAGIVVTFHVFERPTIHHIEFVGNRGIREKMLLKEADLEVGEALNYYAVDEARRKLETFYQGRGYSRAQVNVLEGTDPRDRGVVFRVHEGPLSRVFRVRFEGNTIASDARLKTQIKSKPGFLYVFGGEVEQGKIDEDIERLTAYYRSLGYFQAKVGREISFDSSQKWVTITFIVNEGRRYRVRNVAFVGNERFPDAELQQLTETEAGQFFHLAQMNGDLKALRDLYGSQGYVYADIQADPRFLEEPGQLDLVYNIREGEQYRVGEILVEIEGDNPHTRQTVVLNRRGHLQPGDIIDVRAVRDWERRLQASQLFAHQPHLGITPHIKIVPPESQELGSETASRSRRGMRRLPTVRGQNPSSGRSPLGRSMVDELTRSWPW